MQAAGAALSAFRKEYFATTLQGAARDVYDSGQARAVRYALYDAYCGSNPYDVALFPGADAFKGSHGLYRHTRPVYNPGYRLVEFWGAAVYGGPLDDAAGDGSKVNSAIPITGASVSVRGGLAALWAASKMARKKTLYARMGARLGDAPILIDDAGNGQLALRFLHPGRIADATFAPDGQVASYVLEERRPDPLAPPVPLASVRQPRRTAVYTEVARLDGQDVVYETYRDGRLFNWRGEGSDGRSLPPTWSVPYGFVPLVLAQHMDAGRDFGVGELAAALAKGMEGDDLGSKINDQIRTVTLPQWLLSGFTEQEFKELVARNNLAAKKSNDPADPNAGRASVRFITASNKDAKVSPLVANLNLGEATAHVATILDSQLQDYPELRYDRLRGDSAVSAAALREARKPVEMKVQERRSGYDEALVRAQKMALAIGGWRHAQGSPGHDAFAGFDLADYFDGKRLAHAIDHRPAIAVDLLDRIAEDTAEATAVKAWVDAGIPLALALARAGWGQADIDKATTKATTAVDPPISDPTNPRPTR